MSRANHRGSWAWVFCFLGAMLAMFNGQELMPALLTMVVACFFMLAAISAQIKDKR